MSCAALPYSNARRVVALVFLAMAAGCGSSTETATAPSPVRCGVNVSLDATTFPPSGGAGALTVTTARECTWSAASDAAWVQLASPANGQGDGRLAFTVAANDAAQPRNAAITVNGERRPLTQQARPCEIRLSSTEESIAPEGGERSIFVSAVPRDCTWTAAADVSWITVIEGREGTGDGEVTLRVAAATGPSRTGTVTIARQEVRIQQGHGCAFTLTPPSLQIPTGGGAATVQIGTAEGCAWSAAVDQTWLGIASSTNGNGPASIGFVATANPGPERRATATIAGHALPIVQAGGCSYAVGPQSAGVGAAGGTIPVSIVTGGGCAWSASSSSPWMTLSTTSGSGIAAVTLTLAANTGPERTGTATIAGQTIRVIQASGCTYTVSPPSASLPPSGATGTVALATGAGCPWTASASAGWINLANGSGTGPAQVTYTVASNTGPPRTASLSVAGQTIAVAQTSACTFVLAPPFHDFDGGGGNGNVLVIVSGPCTWTAGTTTSWIRMTAGESGTGDGLVQFVVLPNTSGAARSGTVTIAGQQYPVTQRQ